jgi:hypothetical protein
LKMADYSRQEQDSPGTADLDLRRLPRWQPWPRCR